MEHEIRLLAAAVQSRDDFHNLETHKAYGELSDKAKIVWKVIRDYYDIDHNVPFAERMACDHIQAVASGDVAAMLADYEDLKGYDA